MQSRQYRQLFLKSTFWILLLAISLSALLMSCAEIRKLTYPKDFVYVEKKDLDNTMVGMYAAFERLNTLLANANEVDTQRQQQVIAQLDALEQLARSIRGKGEMTNHLQLDAHMDEFLQSIEDAKLSASNQPPNYYLAGRLSGSCSGCHRDR